MVLRMLFAYVLGFFLILPMTELVLADGGHAATESYAGGSGMGAHHQTAGHMIRHLLKHQKELGLSPDQVNKLKSLQMDLTRTRIRAEADIQIADAELSALEQDEKADLGALEAKVKQSEALRSALRLAVIKTKRDVLAILTPEQREKEKTQHEKIMHEMQRSHGSTGGGMMEGKGEMRHREKKEEPK